MVSQNNDGNYYEIGVDTAKEGAEVWSLNDWFKARVGDEGTPLVMQFYTQGQLNSFDGHQKPIIQGNVGAYSFDDQKQIVMAADAKVVSWTGDPTDMLPGGRVRYHFPQQMFPTEGAFYGFVGYVDESNGRRLTGVNVWFRVLGGVAQMGKACDYYISDLDIALANAKEKMRQAGIDFKSATDTALQDLRTKYQQEAQANQDASETTRAGLLKLADSVGAIQAQIDAGNVVTRKDFAQGLDKVSGEITSRLAKMDNGVHAFATAQTIKDKYPTGADGIFVAVDTGHQWYWSDGAWVDAGSYQTSGLVLPDENLNRTVIAYPYGGSDSITFGKENGTRFANLNGNDISLRGSAKATITNSEILNAVAGANLDTVSVTGQKISGTDFVLVYRPSTEELLVNKMSVKYMIGDVILLASVYNEAMYGAIVDYYAARDASSPKVEAPTRTVIAYPYGGSDGITFGKDGLRSTIDLAGNSVNIYGTKNKKFSNAELLGAFSNAEIDTVSVTGQKISGTDFVLVYRPSTEELLVNKLSVEYMYGDIILIASEYGETLWGPLVDYYTAKNITAPALTYHVYSATSSFWYHQSVAISPYRLSDSKRTIKIPATGFYVRTNVSRVEVSQNTLDDFLTKANIGFDPVKREILSNDLILYYDLQSYQLGSAKSNYILSDDQLPLLIVSYRHELSGAWIDSSRNYNDTSAYPGVPGYWRDMISNKIQQIRREMVSASANSFTFLWITDTHWSSNDKNSPALVKAVMDNTNVPYMVHGGDLITQGEKLDMIDSAVGSLNALKQPGYALPVVLGNHDLNSNWADRGANAGKIFSYPEMLKLYVNQQATPEGVELVDYPNSLAWKADYSSRGPKRSPQVYGFAWDTNDSSNVTTGQIQAFIDLCKRPGYVLTFLHWALDNGSWSRTSREIGKLIDAINAKSAQVELASYGTFQLDGVQAHVVFTLSGHEHQDNVRQTDNGTPQIVTTCDAGRLKASNDAFSYTPGTPTEQAFDVFIVDFDAKKIKDIRVGRGNDREFSFV